MVGSVFNTVVSEELKIRTIPVYKRVGESLHINANVLPQMHRPASLRKLMHLIRC